VRVSLQNAKKKPPAILPDWRRSCCSVTEVKETVVASTAHVAVPAPARFAIPASDWEALVATRVNTVVVGHEDDALGVWTAVWPTLQKPIYWVDADRLSLPRQSSGTLILQDAHALSASAQQQVFDWLDRDAHATRVLTATPHALYPLVENGTFLEALYYRLNMLLLIL
jgi:Sigma-54 interaction domain